MPSFGGNPRPAPPPRRLAPVVSARGNVGASQPYGAAKLAPTSPIQALAHAIVASGNAVSHAAQRASVPHIAARTPSQQARTIGSGSKNPFGDPARPPPVGSRFGALWHMAPYQRMQTVEKLIRSGGYIPKARQLSVAPLDLLASEARNPWDVQVLRSVKARVDSVENTQGAIQNLLRQGIAPRQAQAKAYGELDTRGRIFQPSPNALKYPIGI